MPIFDIPPFLMILLLPYFDHFWNTLKIIKNTPSLLIEIDLTIDCLPPTISVYTKIVPQMVNRNRSYDRFSPPKDRGGVTPHTPNFIQVRGVCS